MTPDRLLKSVATACLLVVVACAHAEPLKVGLTFVVEGDGVFWNPVITKVLVKEVGNASLAQAAGIQVGDEIIQVEGQQVVGKRARDLQAFMKFNAGETRTLVVKHANGQQQEAKITKPKE